MRQLPSTMTPELLRSQIKRTLLPNEKFADMIGIQRSTLQRYLSGRAVIPLFVQRCTHYLLETMRLQQQIDNDDVYGALLKTIRQLP